MNKDCLRYADPGQRAKYKKDYMREYMQQWRSNHPAAQKKREHNYYNNLRKKALDKLGGPKCCVCGCTIGKILEINHKAGGGRKEFRKFKLMQNLYRAIVNETVDISKYDVRCRICNAAHYVSDILGIKGHVVIWCGRGVMEANRSSKPRVRVQLLPTA